ncbi:MAG: hypothetical protein OXI50_15675, partial [Gammaproteobacteria bacterium]|nr:hypothetical protein [Gammaproteobacteria bacterium]
ATGGAGTAGFLLVKGEPTDTVRVTWVYQTRNAAPATGTLPFTATDVADDATLGTAPRTTFTARTATTPASFTAPATSGRGSAADGATVNHQRVTTYIIPDDAADVDYGAISVRIGNGVTDASGTNRTTAEALSVPVALAAVDNPVTELSARMVPPSASTGTHHNIDATWRADGSPQMEQRVALWVGGLGPDNDQQGWVIIPDDALTITRSTSGGSGFARWTMTDIDLSTVTLAGWTSENLGVGVSPRQSDLMAASRLLVQTRAHDSDDWESFAVDISGR